MEHTAWAREDRRAAAQDGVYLSPWLAKMDAAQPMPVKNLTLPLHSLALP